MGIQGNKKIGRPKETYDNGLCEEKCLEKNEWMFGSNDKLNFFGKIAGTGSRLLRIKEIN